MKKVFSILLSILMLFSFTAIYRKTFADTQSDYSYINWKNVVDDNDLSSYCAISSTQIIGDLRNILLDKNARTFVCLLKDNSISIDLYQDVTVKYVFFEFYNEPNKYVVKQFDADDKLIKFDAGNHYLNNQFDVDANTVKIVITSKEDKLAISSMYLFSKIPSKSYHEWEEVPEKLDFLAIATHPDDDVLFLGAAIATSAGEYGLKGTICYTCTRNRTRMTEGLNGAWTMGVRYMPFFARFGDYVKQSDDKSNDFTEAKVTLYYVRLFRQYKPEVVFTQDTGGEYGHWQHRTVSKCVSRAVKYANDPKYDKYSYEKYGTWEVKKLYVHLYKNNKIKIAYDKPLDFFEGKTAEMVAKEAFLCHESQLSGRHYVSKSEVYDLSDFGLAYTTVGDNTPGMNNPFEHVSISKPIYAQEISRMIKAATDQVKLSFSSLQDAYFLETFYKKKR